MKLLKLIALTGLALACAQAATINYTSSAIVNSTPSNLLFTPDIPLFDPTMGTLTEVLLEFDATLQGDFSFANNSNSNGTISGSASSEFVLAGPGALGNLIVLTPAIAFSGPVAANSVRNITGASASDSDTFSSTQAAVLSAFTGVGNVAFSGTATQTGSPVLNFNPGVYTQSLSGAANLSVTYTYTPAETPNEIPEPGTWALMIGGGLLMLARTRAGRIS